MSQEWTTQPRTSGWYEIQWEPDGSTNIGWIHVGADGFLVWGWDAADDPEALVCGESDDGEYPHCRPTSDLQRASLRW